MGASGRRTARSYQMNCSPTCRVCGCRIYDKQGSLSSATIDHLTPRCQGGTDRPHNLLLVCAGCNHSKGGRTPVEWIATIAKSMGVDLQEVAGRPSAFAAASSPHWF